MSFFRYVTASAAVWLVFIAGYLCRGALGDWLVSAHTGAFQDQVVIVSTGLARVFVTFILVAVVSIVCASVAAFTVALLQEIWWQAFHRRLVSLFFKNRRLPEAPEIDDDDDIGAPKESVSALKHARRVRTDPNRIKQLSAMAEVELRADELEQTEVKVTIRDA